MPALGFCSSLLLAACAAQGEVSLAAIIGRMAENLARAPNYTCTQTVDRFKRGENCRRCEYKDRLRLEVAMIDGHEQFAWPASGGFEDRDIYDLIGSGAIVTGDFAALAGTVFVVDRPEFRFAGNTTFEGRQALRYDFQIATRDSSFRARTVNKYGVSGYTGSFWADPETLDVLRLDVTAADFPPEIDLKQFEVSVKYMRLQIGTSDFLLPRSTEAVFLSRGGIYSRNQTEYSGCRQYVGESTIRFGEQGTMESSAATAQPGPPTLIEIPPNLGFDTRLQAPLRITECAIGDPVAFVLAQKVRWKGNVVPKDAVVRGRIVHFAEHLRPNRIVLLGIRTSSVEFAGRQVPFRGRLLNQVGSRRLTLRVAPTDYPVIPLGPEQKELPKGHRFYWITEEKP